MDDVCDDYKRDGDRFYTDHNGGCALSVSYPNLQFDNIRRRYSYSRGNCEPVYYSTRCTVPCMPGFAPYFPAARSEIETVNETTPFTYFCYIDGLNTSNVSYVVLPGEPKSDGGGYMKSDPTTAWYAERDCRPVNCTGAEYNAMYPQDLALKGHPYVASVPEYPWYDTKEECSNSPPSPACDVLHHPERYSDLHCRRSILLYDACDLRCALGFGRSEINQDGSYGTAVDDDFT
jgi:hypothetical protein